MKVILYTKKNCPLCDEAHEILQEMKHEIPLDIEEIDIYSDDKLLEAYQLKIPVIVADGRELDYGKISIETLRRKLKPQEMK